MKRIVGILFVIVVMITLLHTSKECFFDGPATEAICSKVKKGTYPQISLENVLDDKTCAEIIRVAEMHAKRVGGWETDRHDDYPTTDFDTADIPELKFPIQNIVYREIIPKMTKEFKLDPLKLGIEEIFIAKYSAKKGEQKSLAKHVDGSDFSFVIALNSGFEGGGTKFSNGLVKSPKVGSAVGFCGQTKHQGLKVTSGTRYIMAGFLKYNTPQGCIPEEDSEDEAE
jgi:hypothetical protein